MPVVWDDGLKESLLCETTDPLSADPQPLQAVHDHRWMVLARLCIALLIVSV